MARKPKASEEAAKPAFVMVKPGVVLSDDTPTYYINHADAAAGQYEVSLLVTRLPAKATAEQLATAQATGRLEVPAELQLLFPPDLLPGFIRALTKTKENYETQFRAITDLGATDDET